MSAFQITIVALLGALVLMLATIFASGPRWGWTHERSRGGIHARGGVWRSGPHHADRRRDRHNCGGENAAAHLEIALDFVARDLNLTEAQRPTWRALRTGLQESGTRFEALCADVHAGSRRNPVDALDQAEHVAEVGLDELRRIKPLFEAFYDTLTPAQRTRIDEHWSRRR